MIGPGDDLTTLSEKGDHLGVLRYVRAHELREPTTVITHGLALFGDQLDGAKSCEGASRAAALEQLCMAAIDIQEHDLAERCLDQLKNSPVFDSDGKKTKGSLLDIKRDISCLPFIMQFLWVKVEGCDTESIGPPWLL